MGDLPVITAAQVRRDIRELRLEDAFLYWGEQYLPILIDYA